MTLDIVDLSHDGRGVARVDGKATFVAGALPGETVVARRIRKKRDFDEAEAISIEKASPDRVAPRCKHFGAARESCGGCVLQHLGPAAQIAAKQDTLLQNLKRIGAVTPDRVLPPLTAGHWGYRRRARLGVKWVRNKNRVLVGFRERGGRFIADLERCPVLVPSVGERLPELARLIEGLSIRERIPQIEVAAGDDNTVLILRHLEPLTEQDRQRLAAFAQQHQLVFYLQPKGLASIAPLEQGVELNYAVPAHQLRFRFEPAGFVQVNAELNQRMIALALDKLALTATDRVVDLFCGLGNFTLPIARTAQRVVGVEGDPQLIELARDNARANQIENADFFTADLTDPRSSLAEFGQLDYNKVLLDPARSGAEAVLPAVVAGRPERIVYVSCHPGSLARDAGVLVKQHGYRLSEAGVMDMFPHTAHVESIALLVRSDAA